MGVFIVLLERGAGKIRNFIALLSSSPFMKLLNQSEDVGIASTLFVEDFKAILYIFKNVFDNGFNFVRLNLRNNAVVAVVDDAFHGSLGFSALLL